MKKGLQVLAVIIFYILVEMGGWRAQYVAETDAGEGNNVGAEISKNGELTVDLADQITYWTIPVEDYEVSLKDHVQGESMQLVMKRNEVETVVQVFEPGWELFGESDKPENYQAATFENLLGHNGFCVYQNYDRGVFYADYYALDGEEEDAQLLHLAKTWGTAEDAGSRELEDYMIDLDGDGDRELVATVQYSGDGAIRTFIYHWENGRVMRSDAAELLDEPYDEIDYMSRYSEYLPESNKVRINYWQNDLDDWKTKDYEIDLEKLREHAEVFCESKDVLPLGTVLWQENQNGSVIQEDEEYLYVCGSEKVVKINKETNESVILWENVSEESEENQYHISAYQYSGGCGLLAGNHIYFLDGVNGLATVETDGTGYRQIAAPNGYKADELRYQTLSLRDGTLYATAHFQNEDYVLQDKVFCYQIDDKGELLNARERNPKQHGIPANCEEDVTWDGRMVTEESRELFGRYLLRQTENPGDSEHKWIWYLPGEEPVTVLDESFSLVDYNDRIIVFYVQDYENLCGDNFYTLLDAGTLEQRWITFPGNVLYEYYIGMDEAFLYFISQNQDENRENERDTERYYLEYSFWRLAIEGGEPECIYTFAPGYIQPSSLHYFEMKPRIQNGYLYYVGEQDYAVTLMRRKLDDLQTAETLGEPLYDTGISAIGEMTEYRENFYSGLDSEIKIAETKICCPKVSDEYAGAGKINACMKQYTEERKRYIKGVAEELKYDEDAIRSMYAYSVYSLVNEIPYFDGEILSFYQSESEYQGGGFWERNLNGFTFNIETGERLVLRDIISDSEDELKEIVGVKIEKLMHEDPEAFTLWEDAVSIAKDIVNLDSTSFYLSEEGIHFCFEEEKLSFAGYTEDVLIPYEEFELKIPVGTDSQSVSTEK